MGLSTVTIIVFGTVAVSMRKEQANGVATPSMVRLYVSGVLESFLFRMPTLRTTFPLVARRTGFRSSKRIHSGVGCTPPLIKKTSTDKEGLVYGND